MGISTPHKLRDSLTYNVEIHEVRELVLVLLALGDDSTKSLLAINRQTSYYQEVIEYFGAYLEEPIVKSLKRQAVGEYFQMTMDAICFYFDELGLLRKTANYPAVSWDNKNHIEKWIKDLQAFSDKSNFRQFFMNHLEFYSQQKVLFESQVNVALQWDWLEKHCEIKYDHYHIFISPLTHDMHSTRNFSTENFNEAIMFVSGPMPIGNPQDEQQTAARAARMLFTEIDHNYVNPVSDQYKRNIRKIFKKDTPWVDRQKQSGYRSEYEVFNEYMTWALFSIYAYEQYDSATALYIQNNIETWMNQARGFKKFALFNQYMLTAYKTQQRSIEELIPFMLEWCEHQQ